MDTQTKQKKFKDNSYFGLKERVEELTQLDGAFVVDKDGVVLSAC